MLMQLGKRGASRERHLYLRRAALAPSRALSSSQHKAAVLLPNNKWGKRAFSLFFFLSWKSNPGAGVLDPKASC